MIINNGKPLNTGIKLYTSQITSQNGNVFSVQVPESTFLFIMIASYTDNGTSYTDSFFCTKHDGVRLYSGSSKSMTSLPSMAINEYGMITMNPNGNRIYNAYAFYL